MKWLVEPDAMGGIDPLLENKFCFIVFCNPTSANCSSYCICKGECHMNTPCINDLYPRQI